MLPYRDGRTTRIALILFFLLIIGYAYFEARGVLYGPNIQVTSAVQEVSDPFIAVQGKAERIAELSMNGRPISVTEDGAFNEPYLLSPGLNRIMLDATDRYGRTTQQIVQVVYNPDPNAPKTGRDRATTTTETASSTL
ncbi:MAG: hypothetical protein KBD06_00820 [Candidatus Pacebacteria bacterium]|nr:hypothetical protein [Candidatus Paceibacterota bacterium]